eukprot:TRINITY_DN15662_c0_g1_i1.p1 TRINITY_DN15662_c0_g1~~TRINITY_DN15662_c0_g1_i1.p1  ORF type:complete len:475 (+),score=91.91 TRINITY_DN15662_c0_g1_i1:48-1427(+)
MTEKYEWVPAKRNYEEEAKLYLLKEEPVTSHPLEISGTTPKVERVASVKVVNSHDPLTPTFDPLSTSKGFSDPLAQSATTLDLVTNDFPSEEEGFSPWSSKKANILQKYTTNESIGLPDFMGEVAPKVNMPVDKVKNRLEQLDQDENEEKEILKLTQKDYVKHINDLHQDLQDAWQTEKRVKSLKISIKCAKLLGDTSEVIKFYPSKFVLITEILDTFGKLVYSRIKRIATIYDGDTPIPLKPNFRAEDVADHAKETCRNWFFKIASIREILPRFYVETAILGCYKFLSNDNLPRIINRLSRMIRGMGDPLVATYARAYLARKAHEVAPKEQYHLIEGYNDTIYAQERFTEEHLKTMIESRRVTKSEYLDLYSPALDWILQCLAFRANESILNDVLEKYQKCKNGILLNAIISSFLPQQIANNAVALVNFIKETDAESFDKHQLFRTCLLYTSPSPRHS